MIWNVRGLRKNKLQRIWKYLEKFDIIMITETWAREKSEEIIKDMLPNNYEWLHTEVKKEGKGKGRPSGGFLIGSKKSLLAKKTVRERDEGIIGTVKCEIEGESKSNK